MQIYANESCLTALFELFIQVDRKGGGRGGHDEHRRIPEDREGSRRISKDL